MVLLERSSYADIWNSPVDGANHIPPFAIDNAVDHSKAAGNYRSKPGFQKPWVEIHLSGPKLIAGLEVTTLGHEDKKRFKKVIFRAGLTQSPVAKGQGGNDLQTHNTYVLEYVNFNTQGEVIYITFPEPIVAKYILIQGNDFPGSRAPTDSVVLEMAEVRLIKCKLVAEIEIEIKKQTFLLATKICTGCLSKKFPVTPGSILSQSQAFFTESNQSQSSIHVNIMVPGVTGIFLLKHPVALEDS